jgi:YVTN family beta-propeller protein
MANLNNLQVLRGLQSNRSLLSCTPEGHVDLFNTDDGSGRQKWEFSLALMSPSREEFHITVSGGVNGDLKFLSCTSDGGAVNLSSRDDGSGRQRWRFVPVKDSEISQYHNIVVADEKSVSSDRVYLSCRADGTLVDLYNRDDGSGRQRWQTQPLYQPKTSVQSNLPCYAYIASCSSEYGSVSVIDTATDKVVGERIAMAGGPVGVAVTPDGSKVYVANGDGEHVSVIDTATNTATHLRLGAGPVGVAVTPDGSRVYVTNPGSNTVSVIDTATNTVIGSPIAVGAGPWGIAAAPDGRRVYVTNSGSNTVSMIDTATNTVIGSPIAGVARPWGIAVSRDSNKVYIAERDSNAVQVLAVGRGSQSRMITGLADPNHLAATPDGSRVYVSNFGSGTVSVIDTFTDTVIGSPIAVGGAPCGIAVTPDSRKVYVTNAGSLTGGNVWVIDTATNTLVGAAIPVGAFPYSFGAFIRPTTLFSPLTVELTIRGGQQRGFTLNAGFGVRGSHEINPPAEPVTIRVGPYRATLRAGSLQPLPYGKEGPTRYTATGTISNVSLKVDLVKSGGAYDFVVDATPVDLVAVPNPVPVWFSVGDHIGSATVIATRIP